MTACPNLGTTNTDSYPLLHRNTCSLYVNFTSMDARVGYDRVLDILNKQLDSAGLDPAAKLHLFRRLGAELMDQAMCVAFVCYYHHVRTVCVYFVRTLRNALMDAVTVSTSWRMCQPKGASVPIMRFVVVGWQRVLFCVRTQTASRLLAVVECRVPTDDIARIGVWDTGQLFKCYIDHLPLAGVRASGGWGSSERIEHPRFFINIPNHLKEVAIPGLYTWVEKVAAVRLPLCNKHGK